MRTLLIGGARSGKSSLGARWAQERSREVCCLVTAIASDEEMGARIAAHRRDRPAHWRVREAPVHLGAALLEEAKGEGAILIDCLTLWVANCLWPPGESTAPSPDFAGWRKERDMFLQALTACKGTVLIVTNEVGAGIVPAAAAARVFRDEHGWLNQAVASICDEVFLITAGLPLSLKTSG